MEEKLRAAFGDGFINMINNWPQLSSDNIKKIIQRKVIG